MDELIEDMARALLKTRFYDCEPEMYASLESFWSQIDPHLWIDTVAEVDAVLAAIHARGDRVVPGVATGEMLTDGRWTAADDGDNLADVYTAMLSASPYAPEKETAL